MMELAIASEDVVFLKNNKSSAKVHLFGATLISWKVDDVEHLFVSEKSLFDNKKAIRGGVPFVFPQFGPWSNGPQHGFARISRWSVAEKQPVSDKVTLVLEDTERTREMWGSSFRIEYLIALGDRHIEMNVNVINTGRDDLSFTILLHTYFSVPDVKACSVTGLNGCTFIDKVKNFVTSTEDRDEVKVGEATDRIYKKTPEEHIISPVAGGRTIKLQKCNFPDTVVWNPWVEGAKQMSDFGDEEWRNMLCVEAGYVAEPAVVAANQQFSAKQVLLVSNV